MISTPNINQVRNEIQKLHKEKQEVIVLAQDDIFNRKILENPKVDILLSPERLQEKDKLKQRASGLNEIMCKLATKNNIKIGIDLDDLKNKQGKERAQHIARLIQNIKLCKRTKTQLIIFPRNKYPQRDVFSLLLTLGASTEQAKGV